MTTHHRPDVEHQHGEDCYLAPDDHARLVRDLNADDSAANLGSCCEYLSVEDASGVAGAFMGSRASLHVARIGYPGAASRVGVRAVSHSPMGALVTVVYVSPADARRIAAAILDAADDAENVELGEVSS